MKSNIKDGIFRFKIQGLAIHVLVLLLFSLMTVIYFNIVSGQTSIAHNNSATIDETLLPNLFEKVKPSVVQIIVTGKNSFLSGLGSGFVYDEAGHIITNNHVVDSIFPNNISGGELIVTFLNGKSFKAQVIGTDPFSDLAVLQVNGTNHDNFIPLNLGNSSKLKIGEHVVAIGNPFGLSGSMTEGIISGLGRLLPTESPEVPDLNPNPEDFTNQRLASFSIPEIIQTDAAINPGNSGGPLLNLKQEVIGINSAIFSTTGAYSGIGFSIPSNTVKKIVPILLSEHSYKHPWIGISGTDLTPDVASVMNLTESSGFLIIETTPDSPAAIAGLHGGNKVLEIDGRKMKIGGDIIQKLDSQNVSKIDDILTYLEENKNVGDKINLSIIRNGNVENVTVVLAARPNGSITQAQPWLGITGLDMNNGIASIINVNQSEGVLVIGVVSESPADKSGIKGGYKLIEINGTSIEIGGDIITKVDNQTITNISDLSNYITENKNVGDDINITVIRDGEIKDIKVKLEPKPKLQIIP